MEDVLEVEDFAFKEPNEALVQFSWIVQNSWGKWFSSLMYVLMFNSFDMIIWRHQEEKFVVGTKVNNVISMHSTKE